MKKSIFVLRTIHGLFALYFISCIYIIYYSAIMRDFSFALMVALVSLVLEGILVFFINTGDCPLKYMQDRIGDQTPFFNIFLPKKLAKRAVPFFTLVTLLGIAILIVRFFF